MLVCVLLVLGGGDVCKLAGIRNPKLAKEYLASRGAFARAKDNFGNSIGPLRPKKTAFLAGHFKGSSHTTGFGNKEGWMVTGMGVARLRERAEKINTAIEERNKRKSPLDTHQGNRGGRRWKETVLSVFL